MSLLDQIREGAIECGPDFDATLRRAYRLATQLSYEPLRAWADSELRGYGKDDELPDYRVVPASIWYEAHHIRYRVSRTATWDMFTDDAAYKSASTVQVRRSVAELVSWASDGEDVKLLPAGIVLRELESKLRLRHEGLVSAHQTMSLSSIKGVLSVICTGLLQFVLEIEKLYPEVSAAPLPDDPKTKQAIDRVFTQFIFHGGTPAVSMAAGTMPVASTAISHQSLILINALDGFLREQGIDVDDLAPVIEASTVADVEREDSPIGQWMDRVKEAAKKAGKTISEEALKAVIRQIFSGNVDFPKFTSLFG